MTPAERAKVQAYLRARLGGQTIEVRQRGRKTDSAEVYAGEEFLGVISKDEEDGDLSYHFTMSILGEDLDD